MHTTLVHTNWRCMQIEPAAHAYCAYSCGIWPVIVTTGRPREREHLAIDAVGRDGRRRADHIAGIDVLQVALHLAATSRQVPEQLFRAVFKSRCGQHK